MESFDCALDYTRGKPTPSGMNRGDFAAVICANEQWQTVRRERGEHDTWRTGDCGIGFRRPVILSCAGVESRYGRAMYLAQPTRLRWQLKPFPQQSAIF